MNGPFTDGILLLLKLNYSIFYTHFLSNKMQFEGTIQQTCYMRQKIDKRYLTYDDLLTTSLSSSSSEPNQGNIILATMIQTCSEEQNDLADDTNDAVDDIVASLITCADPIFGASNQSILGCNHQTNLDPVSSSKNANKKMSMISSILH